MSLGDARDAGLEHLLTGLDRELDLPLSTGIFESNLRRQSSEVERHKVTLTFNTYGLYGPNQFNHLTLIIRKLPDTKKSLLRFINRLT